MERHVEIIETRNRIFTVDADTDQEAIDKIADQFESGGIILSEDDVNDYTIRIKDNKI